MSAVSVRPVREFEPTGHPRITTVANRAALEVEFANREQRYEPGDLFVVAGRGQTIYIEYPYRRQLICTDGDILHMPYWYTRYFAHYQFAWYSFLNVPVDACVDPTDGCMFMFFPRSMFTQINQFLISYHPRDPAEAVTSMSTVRLYFKAHADDVFRHVRLDSHTDVDELNKTHRRVILDRQVEKSIRVMYLEAELSHNQSLSDYGTAPFVFPDMKWAVPGWHFTAGGNEHTDIADYYGPAKHTQEAVDFLKRELRQEGSNVPTIHISPPDTEFILALVDQFSPVDGHHRRWPHLTQWLCRIVPVLMEFNAPPYVILEIVDWLPWFDWVKHISKIRRIESIIRSVRAVRAARQSAALKLNKIQ